jgi:hypothetical protein
VGMISANKNFQTTFADVALRAGLASKTRTQGSIQVYPETSAAFGPLAGLWFNERVANTLRETFGPGRQGFESQSTSFMNNIGKVISRATGVATLSSTQMGIGYWPRNAMGGFLLNTAQGVVWNPFSSKTRGDAMSSVRAAFARLGTDNDVRAEILRLVELNVWDDQAQGRVPTDLLRGFVATPVAELQEMMADIEEARITKDAGGVIARMRQKPLLGKLASAIGVPYTKTAEFLGSMDSALDGLFKANLYYFELDVAEKHYGDTKSKAEKERIAADKVKATMPGYSQVLDQVRSFQRMPFAQVVVPFIRWKTEVIRTMINTIPLAVDEINQGGVMAQRGVRRLLGFTATLTAAPTILGTLGFAVFRALSGEEGDEERKLTPEELAALRESLPSYQRGNSIYAQLLKGGKVQFVDMTYILPYSQTTDLVNIISDGIRTGEPDFGAARLGQYVTSQLLGLQIAASAAVDIISNDDGRGNPIFLESDGGHVRVGRMLAHYYKGAIQPGALRKFGQIARTGEQDRKELIVGELIGARPRIDNLSDIERRGMSSLKRLQDEAVSVIGEVSSGRYATQKDIDRVVDRHQAALNEAQRRLSRFMVSMEALGSDPAEIQAAARQARFSADTVQSAWGGYRLAWRPSQQWVVKAANNAERRGEQLPQEKVDFIFNAVGRKPGFYWVRGGGE